MKDKTKTKRTHSNTGKVIPEPSNHENFKLGQGYGSGEDESDFQEHPSEKQFGDNPRPQSGGGYAKSGHAQPKLDADALNADQRNTNGQI
jgi:hypothetical protein